MEAIDRERIRVGIIRKIKRDLHNLLKTKRMLMKLLKDVEGERGLRK